MQPVQRIYNCSLTRMPQHKLKMIAHVTDNLPTSYSLRSMFPYVYDQGQLGSCTANALAALVRYRTHNFNPSRLFIYYNERNIENSTSTDSGAMLSDGVKTLRDQGVCSELIWPYDISKFADKPPSPCYKLAKDHTYMYSQNIDNTDIHQLKASIFNGDPIVVGIAVFDSFESEVVAKTGRVNMPVDGERMLGGHAILVVGYDDDQQRVTCLNSWGSQWGNQGFFTLPYNFIIDEKLTSDCWTFRTV